MRAWFPFKRLKSFLRFARLSVFIGFFTWPVLLISQTRIFTVTDADSDIPLYQSYVWNLQSNVARVTDEQGLAYLPAEPGDSVHISYVGYDDTTIVIVTDRKSYEIKLKIKTMKEIVILAEQSFHREAAQGRQQVSMDFLTAIPSLTGDADIMKTLTFLPGVSGGQEGYSHLMVRGGGQDQNLILLDGATLFNVNHFGGFISMFHSEMIRAVDFYKSFWPSRFGGRLSSVLDLRSAPGDYQKHHQAFDLGIIYSKAKLNGPIWKDKVSYSIGARRTFVDLITGPMIRKTRHGKRIGELPNIAVGDANARMDARIADDQHLSLTFFYGNDKLDYFSNVFEGASDERYSIRNTALALNYSWHVNARTNWRLHASRSGYRHAFDDDIRNRYNIYGNEQFYEIDIFQRKSGNKIRSLKAGLHGDLRLENNWNFSYGAEIEQMDYSLFLDRSQQYQLGDMISTVDSLSETTRRSAGTLAIYGDANYRINDRWRVKSGIRIPHFRHGTFGKFLLEPKILATYEVNSLSSLSFSFNLQQQHTTLLGYTTMEGYFREFYTTADRHIPPGRSYQWSAGYFSSPVYDWIDHLSAEVFYKNQSDLVRFVPSTDADLNVLDYEDFLFHDGENRTYGAEFLLQKTAGQVHASLSYTYAHSRARFPDLNGGSAFPADYDFRHNVSVLLMYMWGKGYKIAAGWNYQSGRPFTLPNSHSPPNDLSPGFPVLTDINGFRMPASHRLDLNLDREYKTKRGKKQWFGISIYNAYNRVNPFYASPDDKGNLKIYGFFPIIPAVHFGFEP